MSSGDPNASLVDGTLNSTLNSTLGPTQNRLQSSSFAKLLDPDFLLLEAKVIFSALSIIWIAAHASLRRPPSAAPSKGPKNKRSKDPQFAEGFVASDAIMLPVMAGIVLIGLYYLIEYLQDPDILNKILRIYISTVSVASLARLATDSLNIVTSFVFPEMWVNRRGDLFRIDAEHRRHVLTLADGRCISDPARLSPFPSYLSSVRWSERTLAAAWEMRHLFTEEWTARLAMHGLGSLTFNLRLNTLLGVLVSILISVAYHVTGWHLISNLLGSALTYSSFSLMSPTSFAIGSMVLAGLFIYDIVMVFYTPFMITVAKKVDAPIKLVFQGANGMSLLGLGDIIVPGLLMGLALRFDLYRHYQKKIKLEKVHLTASESSESVSKSEPDFLRVKAPYVDPQGQWGSRFWTTKLGRLSPVPLARSVVDATAFPKPYFYAAMVGYLLGMLVTLTIMAVFEHGQPALLYLVPGVTGSLWTTAIVRGELKEFWGYTEDGTLDTKDVVVEVDGEGKEIAVTEKEDKKEMPEENKTKAVKEKRDDYDVFLFSITAPRHRTPKRD